METIRYPKPIPVDELFDIDCSVSETDGVSIATWTVIVPVDKAKYFTGVNLLEALGRCFPEINSTTIEDYIGEATQVPLP
jgi:hypothetical protein